MCVCVRHYSFTELWCREGRGGGVEGGTWNCCVGEAVLRSLGVASEWIINVNVAGNRHRRPVAVMSGGGGGEEEQREGGVNGGVNSKVQKYTKLDAKRKMLTTWKNVQRVAFYNKILTRVYDYFLWLLLSPMQI